MSIEAAKRRALAANRRREEEEALASQPYSGPISAEALAASRLLEVSLEYVNNKARALLRGGVAQESKPDSGRLPSPRRPTTPPHPRALPSGPAPMRGLQPPPLPAFHLTSCCAAAVAPAAARRPGPTALRLQPALPLPSDFAPDFEPRTLSAGSSPWPADRGEDDADDLAALRRIAASHAARAVTERGPPGEERPAPARSPPARIAAFGRSDGGLHRPLPNIDENPQRVVRIAAGRPQPAVPRLACAARGRPLTAAEAAVRLPQAAPRPLSAPDTALSGSRSTRPSSLPLLVGVRLLSPERSLQHSPPRAVTAPAGVGPVHAPARTCSARTCSASSHLRRLQSPLHSPGLTIPAHMTTGGRQLLRSGEGFGGGALAASPAWRGGQGWGGCRPAVVELCPEDRRAAQEQEDARRRRHASARAGEMRIKRW